MNSLVQALFSVADVEMRVPRAGHANPEHRAGHRCFRCL
jgi:hypothetical protein